MPRYSDKKADERRAVVILAVLVVVVLLALAGYHYSALAFSGYKAANYGHRQAQALALADSGVHYAAALLSNADTMANTLNHNPYSNSALFANVAVPGDEGKGFKGKFTLLAPPDNSNPNGDFRHGVIDEGGKLNLNSLIMWDSSGNMAQAVLSQLPNMTTDAAGSIADWLDQDDNPNSTGGAENTYYSGMNPPYRCRNGFMDSLDELLLVKGVTPELLYGQYRNPYPQPLPGQLTSNGNVDRGLSAFLTVHSRELTCDLSGNALTNINDTSSNAFTNISQNLGPQLGTALTNYIILYRQYGGSKVSSKSASSSSSSRASFGDNELQLTQAGGGGKTGGGKTGGGKGGGGTMGGGKGGGGTMGGGGKGGGTMGGKGGKGGGGKGSGGTKGGGGNNETQSKSKVGSKKVDPANAQLDSTKQLTNKIPSMFSLVNTQVTVPSDKEDQPDLIYPSPLNDPGNQTTLLPKLFTYATLWSGNEIPARININTAPAEVLNALAMASTSNQTAFNNATMTNSKNGGLAINLGNPTAQGLQLTTSDVQTILSTRPALNSDQPVPEIFATPAWLLTQANLPMQTLTSLDKYFTTRSQVYKVQVQGVLDGPEAITARVEAVIDTNGGRPRILAYRNLSELGKGSR
jgi:type II secretory pathway component PulK